MALVVRLNLQRSAYGVIGSMSRGSSFTINSSTHLFLATVMRVLFKPFESRVLGGKRHDRLRQIRTILDGLSSFEAHPHLRCR